MLSRHTHLWRLLIVCIYTCIFTPFILQSHALADSDPISVTSQTDTIVFPKAIDFQMSAHDDGGFITQATLFLSFTGDSYQDQHDLSTSPATATASFKWHEDISSSNFTPVGSTFKYYWVIIDNAGHSHSDKVQTFSVTDTRFNWQHLSQNSYQVNWYARPNSFGQTLLTQVSLSLKHITKTLGLSLSQPINVWVYSSIDDFHGALPPQAHEWAGGIAFPSFNQASIVIEDVSSQRLSRDLPHELTHLMFHQGLRTKLIPVWFDEGLAVYNQAYHEPLMSQIFQDALLSHKILPLNSIAGDFPNDSDQADLAYAQSWKLIDYMYSTFSQPKMAAFLKNMHTFYGSFDDVLHTSLHIDTAHLEYQWLTSLHQPAIQPVDQSNSNSQSGSLHMPVIQTTDNATPALTLLGILLIFLPALSFSGLVIQRRRSAERIKHSQQAQRILDMAFSPSYLPVEPARQEPKYPHAQSNNYMSPYTYLPPPGTSPLPVEPTNQKPGYPYRPPETYLSSQPQLPPEQNSAGNSGEDTTRQKPQE